jgi:phage repressor protein C with HTH and peptisase S24 domain
MPPDAYGRRQAIRAFMDANGLKIFPWSQAAGLSNNVLHNFLRGDSETLTDVSYEKLAAGATLLLRRPVTAAEIRGEPAASALPIKVVTMAGAGATVIPIPDEAVDYDEIPVDPSDEWIAVRGDSQRPRYEQADLIRVPKKQEPPERGLYSECLVQLKDGSRYIKRVVPGTRPGRFTLESFNAEPMVDVEIDWVTPFRRRAIFVW